MIGRYSVLFKTTTYKSIEKNRKSRNKSAHGHSTFNKGTKIIQWKKESLSTNGTR